MTKNEYDKWWNDFCARFPSATSWFANGRSATDQKQTHAAWQDTLKHADLADAIAINTKVMDGTIEQWTSIDKIPSFYLYHCRMERIRRTSPPDEDNWKKHSYKCLNCKDTGWVFVWLAKAIRRLIVGDFAVSTRSGVVACSCGYGANKARKIVNGSPVEGDRYNPEHHCLYRGDSQESVDLAVEWAERVKNKQTKGNPVLAGWNTGDQDNA